MSDWFEDELGIDVLDKYCFRCGEGDSDWCGDCHICKYCKPDTCDCTPYCSSCGKGDGDWCDDCEGCRYRNCGTCSCDPYCSSCGQGDSDWCSDCEQCTHCDGSCGC